MRISAPRVTSHQLPQLDLIYFDAGGGHRASATALKRVVEQQHRRWQINLVNLRDLLDPADVIRRFTGIRVEDFYNSLLKSGLTIGTGPMLRITQMFIRRLHPTVVNLLAHHWRQSQPALVVSVVPNFNRAIFDGLRASDHELNRVLTPMLTILTDLADYPTHFWMELQEQYFACATDLAVKQALEMGHPRERIFKTSGMIVRPEFYLPIHADRAQERERLGLRPDLPTGLVMFGGHGSRKMLTIAKRVAAAGLKTQLIFICGHNQHLRDQLMALELQLLRPRTQRSALGAKPWQDIQPPVLRASALHDSRILAMKSLHQQFGNIRHNLSRSRSIVVTVYQKTGPERVLTLRRPQCKAWNMIE